jgi:hypothetical protein
MQRESSKRAYSPKVRELPGRDDCAGLFAAPMILILCKPSVAEKEEPLFWDCYFNENTNHNVWSDRSPTKRDS